MDETMEDSTTFQNYCLKRQKLKCVTLFGGFGQIWPEPQPFIHFVHFGHFRSGLHKYATISRHQALLILEPEAWYFLS